MAWMPDSSPASVPAAATPSRLSISLWSSTRVEPPAPAPAPAASASASAPSPAIASHSALIASSSAISAKNRSEEHTSDLHSLIRISYAVFCQKQQTRIGENILAMPDVVALTTDEQPHRTSHFIT